MSASHESKRKSSKKDGVKIPRAKKRWIPDQPLLLLGGIMLLGLVIRLLPALYCIVGGKVIFLGPDSYYHMRRTVYTVLHFPNANIFDSYVNYPAGYPIFWPPLYDIINAVAALVAGLGHPDAFTMEVTASLVPVLMGVVVIALVYYITKDALNEKAALLAAFILAILPAGVFRSLFAVVDHHELEVLVSLAMYLFFMRAVSGAKKAGPGIPLFQQPRPLAYAVLAGASTACMILSWDGAPLFIGLMVAYAFVQYAYDAVNREHSGYMTAVGLVSILSATLIILPFVAGSHASQQFNFSAVELSWFHIAYLGGIILFFVAMGFLSGLCLKRNAPWYALPVSFLAIAAVGALAFGLVFPQFFYGIKIGLVYLSGAYKVMSTVSEVEPLFLSLGQPSLLIPWAYFSFIGPIAIVGFIAYLLHLRRKKLNEMEIFFIVWTVIVLAMGIAQKRFLNILAVNASIFGGYALYRALEFAGLEEYLAPSHKKTSASKAGSMSPALMGATIAMVLLLIPVLMNTFHLAGTPEFYSLDWNDATAWVKDNTPVTSFLYAPDPGNRPEYGIMSWWDYGNYILYRAERPAIANNFQTGVNESALFFIAQDEGSADGIMDTVNAKYVMLDYRLGSPFAGIPFGIFENMAYLVGKDVNAYHDNRSKNLSGSANFNYYNSMFSRLYYLNGCSGNVSGRPIGALEHYRLLYATQGVDPVKVFEYVKGARLTGKADPGATLELKLTVTSPHSKGTYDGQTVAGPDGQYTFVVPYATSSTSYVKTGAAYVIRGGGISTSVEVPESAVLDGTTLPVSG